MTLLRLHLLLLLVLCGATPPAGAADAPAARPGPESFFQPARFGAAELSPDGRRVAFTVARVKGERLSLALLDLETMKPSMVVSYADSDIGQFHWVDDQRLVFDLTEHQTAIADIEDAPGLFAINADGSRLRQLVDRRGERFVRAADEPELLPWNTFLLGPIGRQDGNDVYVVKPLQIDDKQVDYVQLQRVNTLNGRAQTVDAPLHSFGWVFDPDGQLAVAVTLLKDRETVLAREAKSGEWSALATFDRFAAHDDFHPAHVDEAGRLFVETAHGADKTAVYTYDLAHRTLADKPFISSERYDLSPTFITVGGRLKGLRYTVDAEVTQWIDPEWEALQARIDRLLPATVNRLLPAARGDGRFVLLEAFSDRLPGRYYLFNVAQGKLISLGDTHPEVDPAAMSRMEQVRYPARDGLEIPAYLTVPRGAARRNLPLVVLVHGGPYVRGHAWGWDPQVQFLAARGYAVLQPEFRGSTGYGARLFEAGWKQWGLAMQDDLADGVKWAVAQGLADPARVCIAGASYGGYAVLMGLVNDPTVYRCGIDWIGVTDIELLYSVGWSDMSDNWKRYGMPRLVGDPLKDAAQFKATSPIENAARIQAPLLLAYGGKDTRVPIVHGEKFRDAMRRVPGARLEWVVYDREGHGWRATETQLDFWSRAARFLDANIGPP